MRNIEENDPQSAYALQILNNKHSYGPIQNNMPLLKQVNKGPLLNPFEQIYIQSLDVITNLFRNKTGEGNLDRYACLPAYLPHLSTVKTLRPTGCSSCCYVAQLSFCISYYYYMTSVFHFSYFNTGYNHNHTCDNCNDQIFFNLKYFYNLKVLCFLVHKSIYYKPHIHVLTTVLLLTGEDKKVKRLFCVTVKSLIMGQ